MEIFVAGALGPKWLNINLDGDLVPSCQHRI